VTVVPEMPSRRLGEHGPELSVIGLGGWQAGGGRTWGSNASDAAVIGALRSGWDRGANWIDTAEVYAQGGSEELIGRALEGNDSIKVMTKVGPRPDGSGVRPGEIEAAIEGSLRRLRRDKIDAYLVHWRDREVPLAETWEKMAELVDRGLVESIGLSNVAAAEIAECAAIRRVDVVQLHASLLYQGDLTELMPVCRQVGAGVVCYGSLAYGLLSGRFSAGDDWRVHGMQSDDFFVTENYERFFSGARLPSQLGRVAALEEVVAELGMTAAQAALAWLLAQTGVTGAIVGSRAVDHIEENLGAASIELSPDEKQLIAAAVRQ
jgi:aryl-alcohol dehydrogenase-like predicted oxidoreductase